MRQFRDRQLYLSNRGEVPIGQVIQSERRRSKSADPGPAREPPAATGSGSEPPLTTARFAALVLIAALVLGAVGLAWYVVDLLVLVFGGIVFAVVLRAIAQPISTYTPLSDGVSFAAAILALVAGLALMFWLLGDQVAAQLGQLFSQLPQAWAAAKAWLEQRQIGQLLLQGLYSAGSAFSGTRMAGFAATAFGGLADALLILVLAILLGANPGLYRRGLLCLVPQSAHDRVADAVEASGVALKAWLLGKALAMIGVGTITGLGLWLLGVPMALGLGFLTALLDFVPIVGPLIAAAPAVLVAFTQSPELALYVALLFIVVQNLEGYAIEPLTQKWAVSLPPALAVVALLLFGSLFGTLGVIFATPLMVVGITLVRKLYVGWALGRE